MKTADTKAELRSLLERTSHQVKTLGFVPTMGALHEGHLSLVRKSVEECHTTVVSIFVNPTQFNDSEDLKKYPRTLEKDLGLLDQILGPDDVVFCPSEKEIYPEPDRRIFDLDPLDKVMEGKFRPGHFNGVAQVVSRLFEIVKPDKAYFGSKDFQQVAIIRRLVELINARVDIVACPIIREPDGLAMSSRNALLDPQARQEAPLIFQALKFAAKNTPGMQPDEIRDAVSKMIGQAKTMKLEYFEIVGKDNLLPIHAWGHENSYQACIAVWAGKVRLIDNIELVKRK